MFDQSMIARQQFSTPNAHDGHAGIFPITRVSDYVAVAALHFHHDRGLFEILETLERITQFARLFEIQSLGGFQHARLHAFHDVTGSTFQKPDHFIDHRAIIFARLQCDTRRLAPLDEVVQARPFRCTVRQVVMARTYGEDTLYHMKRASHGADIGIRPEISRAIVDDLSGYHHAWERLGNRDLDVRIRLVITQRDVEARAILLDKRRFENERVCFGGHHNRFNVAHFAQQAARFRTRIVILRPITAHARPQLFRLSHVQHDTVVTFPEVHAGCVRQRCQLRYHDSGCAASG